MPKIPETVIGPDDSAAFWLREMGKVPMTTWHNPTNNNGYIDLDARFLHPHSPRLMVRVRIPAGKKCVLPSIYDRCVHVVHNGHVVGGMAPAWRCAGSFSVAPELVDETHAPYSGPEAA
jgi:hypothetical protein